MVWDTPPVRMVGREQEFALLVDMLDRAEIGAGGFAVLTGEAGIGKTRLVTEWAAEARRRGFVVLMGRAIAGTSRRLYPAGPARRPSTTLAKLSVGQSPQSLGESVPAADRLVAVA